MQSIDCELQERKDLARQAAKQRHLRMTTVFELRKKEKETDSNLSRGKKAEKKGLWENK